MRLFSNQQIAFMQRVKWRRLRGLDKIVCFQVFPPVENWMRWPFFFFFRHRIKLTAFPQKDSAISITINLRVLQATVLQKDRDSRTGRWHGDAAFVWSAVDRYISSTVPWLSLLWHLSEEDITVTNETPRSLDGLGRARKVRSSVLVCRCTFVCVCVWEWRGVSSG